jgi:hypothetical protein
MFLIQLNQFSTPKKCRETEKIPRENRRTRSAEKLTDYIIKIQIKLN